MKNIKFYLANILLIICLSTSVQQIKAQQVTVSFQSFYDDLSPYGTWVNTSNYGYVWQPNVSGFKPYSTNGHWVWSDEYQWVWVSDYDWGWGPFHYGRWYQDPFNGWEWVPGYDWSPAWVSWRTGGDYYGWAPLSPGFDINFGFDNYAPPVEYWCFAPRRYITSNRIYRYYVTPRQNVTIIKNTTVINNYNYNQQRNKNVYVNGPQRSEAEQYTHHSITPVRFHELDKPNRTIVNKDQVYIYRPKVNESDRNSAKPAQAVPAENVKRDSWKNSDLNRNPVPTNPAKNNVVQPDNGIRVTQPAIDPNQRKYDRNGTVPIQKEADKQIGRQPEGNPPVKNPVPQVPQNNPPVIAPPVREPVLRNPQLNNRQPNQQHDRNHEQQKPAYQPPVRTVPVRTDPVKTQPVRLPPVRTEQPHRMPPVRTEQPQRMPPIRTEPVKTEVIKSVK